MITKALNILRPNAAWVYREDTGLEWQDTEQSQPTEEEINTKVAELKAEYDAQAYSRSRAAEYPPVADYLDGIVKGDQAQIDAYIAACQAVKSKYPKPE
jgi:hypothetical protein